MNKRVVTYLRVSTEEQFGPGTVSITEQELAVKAYCQSQGWRIVAEFMDVQDYVATRKPNKGKLINPSATRDDRPGFTAMLEMIRSGQVDCVVCFRDDRIYRHERVVTALLDAIDEGQAIRKGVIEVHQAAGKIERDFMYLQALMWRKENEARVARTHIGKVGTLKAGFWPGQYHRYGYAMLKAERGNQIVLGDTAEVETVKTMFNWAEQGHSIKKISDLLIKGGHPQPDNGRRRMDWSTGRVYDILSAVDYTGRATWSFRDGTEMSIVIPQIITEEQFKRVQAQMKQNNLFSPRKAKMPYLLQGVGFCGHCGRRIGPRTNNYHYWTTVDGTKKRGRDTKRHFSYGCHAAQVGRCDGRQAWGGRSLEDRVWRNLVDKIIKNPAALEEQVQARRAALQEQGDDYDSEIAKKERYLVELAARRTSTRAKYARGSLQEADFDAIIAEIDAAQAETKSDLADLKILKEDSARVKAGIDYAHRFLCRIQQMLPEIDLTMAQIDDLPEDEQYEVLLARQGIARALCDRILIFANGDIVFEGAISGGADGSEGPSSPPDDSPDDDGRGPAGGSGVSSFTSDTSPGGR